MAGCSSTTSCCRGPFSFVAFDVLVLNGNDVRRLALAHGKRLLRATAPRRSSSACMLSTSQTEAARSSPRSAHDLERIVAKHRESSYGADKLRHWIKVKNTAYSQAVDRHELFER